MNFVINHLTYIVIGGSVLFLLLLMIIFIMISKKKIRKELFKIDLALDHIDEFLEKKVKLIQDTKKIIKNENYLEDMKQEDFDEKDNYQLYTFLDEMEDKFKGELLEDEELAKEEETRNLLENLRNNDIQLRGAIHYYNDAVERYTSLKKTSPVKFVRIFCGFEQFPLFEVKRTNTLY